MKLNVKGLVFVGFAAAVFASAAQAATGDDKKVTSLAYTEATYQAKTTANNANKVLYMQSNTAGDIGYKAISNNSSDIVNDNQKAGVLVDAQAIAQKIAASESATTYTGTAPVSINAQNQISVAGMTGADGTVAGATGLVPAPAATDNVKVLSGAGTWVTNNDTTVATGDANGKIAVTHNGTTTQVPVYGLGSAAYTDSTAYATAAQGEKADGAVQSVTTGTTNGTIAVDGTDVSVYGLGAAAYKGLATNGVADAETGLVTGDEVHDYVAGQITGANLSQYEEKDNKASSIIDSGNDANATSTTEYASLNAVTGYAQKKLSGTNGQLVTYGETAGTVGSATLGTATLTVNQNNVQAGTFGANATSNATINIVAPDWNAASGTAGYIANKPTFDLPAVPSGMTCGTNTPCALVLAGDAPTWEYIQQ